MAKTDFCLIDCQRWSDFRYPATGERVGWVNWKQYVRLDKISQVGLGWIAVDGVKFELSDDSFTQVIQRLGMKVEEIDKDLCSKND